MRRSARRLLACCLLAPCRTFAQAAQAPAAPAESPWYTLHYQGTVIDQGNLRFHAPYAGTNSLPNNQSSAVSETSTIFFGARLLPGTELFINPEVSGGRGVGQALGVAGFTNGEIFRIGNPQPALYAARAFLQQTIGFGEGTERIPDGLNQLEQTLPERRLILRGGKFGMADYFDNNAYSHDPRTQFMNWALMNSGAWDYPADTRGYTWGGMVEYHDPAWALRAAAVAEPNTANQIILDRRFGRAQGFALEGEHQLRVGDRKGTARLLLFFNEARMGNYDQAVALARRTGSAPDVTQTSAYGHTKYGFTSSNDLELADHLGGFLRLSWDDGRNETWAFTEIDQSAALGVEWTAARWGRPKDRWGAAQIVNGLSGPHRRYLADGGYGFIIGDGALHYGPEMIAETYYSFQANDFLALSPDAQLVVNPAYNRARGPAFIFGARAHAQF